MEGVRMDKWLWAARFFKTRSLAARACEMGRVESNGHPAKPAREVKPGDRLQVKTEAGLYVVDVLEAGERRGPAAAAQAMYRETEESKAARAQAIEERKAQPRLEAWGDGKLSKRDRRDWNRLRGR